MGERGRLPWTLSALSVKTKCQHPAPGGPRIPETRVRVCSCKPGHGSGRGSGEAGAGVGHAAQPPLTLGWLHLSWGMLSPRSMSSWEDPGKIPSPWNPRAGAGWGQELKRKKVAHLRGLAPSLLVLADGWVRGCLEGRVQSEGTASCPTHAKPRRQDGPCSPGLLPVTTRWTTCFPAFSPPCPGLLGPFG